MRIRKAKSCTSQPGQELLAKSSIPSPLAPRGRVLGFTAPSWGGPVAANNSIIGGQPALCRHESPNVVVRVHATRRADVGEGSSSGGGGTCPRLLRRSVCSKAKTTIGLVSCKGLDQTGRPAAATATATTTNIKGRQESRLLSGDGIRTNLQRRSGDGDSSHRAGPPSRHLVPSLCSSSRREKWGRRAATAAGPVPVF